MRRKDSASSSSRKNSKQLKPSKKAIADSRLPSFLVPQSPNLPKEKGRKAVIEDCCRKLKSLHLTAEEWKYVKLKVMNEDSEKSNRKKKESKRKEENEEEDGQKPKKPKKPKKTKKEAEDEESDSERKPRSSQKRDRRWDAIGGIKIAPFPKKTTERKGKSSMYMVIPPEQHYFNPKVEATSLIKGNSQRILQPKESDRENKKDSKKEAKPIKTPIPQKDDESPKSEKTDTETEFSIHTSEVLRKERRDRTPPTSPLFSKQSPKSPAQTTSPTPSMPPTPQRTPQESPKSPAQPNASPSPANTSPAPPTPPTPKKTQKENKNRTPPSPFRILTRLPPSPAKASSPVPPLPPTPPKTPQRSPKAEPLIQFENPGNPMEESDKAGKRAEPQRKPDDQKLPLDPIEPPDNIKPSKTKKSEPPKPPEPKNPAEKKFELRDLLNPLESLREIMQFGKKEKPKPAEPAKANEAKKDQPNPVESSSSDKIKKTKKASLPKKGDRAARMPPGDAKKADSKRLEEIRSTSPKPRTFMRDDREARIAMGLDLRRKDDYPTINDAPSDYDNTKEKPDDRDDSSSSKVQKKRDGA